MLSEEAKPKGYILYNSIHTTSWEGQNYRRGEQVSGYQELRSGRQEGSGRVYRGRGGPTEEACVWKDRTESPSGSGCDVGGIGAKGMRNLSV